MVKKSSKKLYKRPDNRLLDPGQILNLVWKPRLAYNYVISYRLKTLSSFTSCFAFKHKLNSQNHLLQTQTYPNKVHSQLSRNESFRLPISEAIYQHFWLTHSTALNYWFEQVRNVKNLFVIFRISRRCMYEDNFMATSFCLLTSLQSVLRNVGLMLKR